MQMAKIKYSVVQIQFSTVGVLSDSSQRVKNVKISGNVAVFWEEFEGKRVLNIQCRKLPLPSTSVFNPGSSNVITLA